MTGWLYLLSILAATLCMGVVDARWRLFLFAQPRAALVVVATGVVFFLLWDVVAIALGMYHSGESAAMTGIYLAPELPLEELFFIVFLCYLTMVLHRLLMRVVARGPGRQSRVGKVTQ